MPPQRILPLPSSPLPPLPRQSLLIAYLGSSDPEIPTHGHEVEPHLLGWVAIDPRVEDGDDLLGEFVDGTWPMGDGVWLQAIELVERVVPNRVADEMEHVFCPGRGVSLRLICEGAAPREAVVRLPDQTRV